MKSYSLFQQYIGYSDLFEVRVARLCEDAHPDKQVFVNIFIRRKQ